MLTARLPTIHALVATRCHYWYGGPQVNKFEQVSSDDHQISLAGRVGLGLEGELYSEVRCTIASLPSHMGTHVDRQRELKTLPSRNFVGERYK